MRLPRLLPPALVWAGAVVVAWRWPGAVAAPSLVLLVWVGLGATLLLALRLRRSATAWSLAWVALVPVLELLPPPVAALVRPLVNVLLPLNLVLLVLVGERRAGALTGWLRGALLVAQGLAVLLLLRPGAEAPRRLVDAALDPDGGFWRSPWVPSFGDLPPPTVAAWALVLVVFAARFVRHPTVLAAGWLGAAAAVVPALAWPDQESWWLAVALAVLAVALVEDAVALAYDDALTGLPSRRSLERHLGQLSRSYAVAMVDLDRFKRLNDRWGHDIGDQVLRLVASRLAAVGGGGRAYRYGGEEMAILFSGATAADAVPHLEAVRKAIADHPFVLRGADRKAKGPGARGRGGGEKGLRVTVSIGVAGPTARRRRPSQVLKAADKALYGAKRGGRNRVVVAR